MKEVQQKAVNVIQNSLFVKNLFLNDVLTCLVFLYFIVQISSVFYHYASFFSLIT